MYCSIAPPMLKALSFTAILLSSGLFLLHSCASSDVKTPLSGSPARSGASGEGGLVSARKLWNRKTAGIITDIGLSRDGTAVFAATVPDQEQEAASGQFQLSRFDQEGALVWSHALPARVRSMSVSADGKILIAALANEEIHAINADNKLLWKVAGKCRPLWLDQDHRLLCIHDDDPLAKTAFELFDADGKTIKSVPGSLDLMANKLSRDQQSLVLGLAQGQVSLYQTNGKSIWQKRVPGEILDVAVADGTNPYVAVLYHSSKDGQRIALLNSRGIVVADGEPALHSEQIELAPGGKGVFAYGNGPKGQYLGSFPFPVDLETSTGKTLSWHPKWKQGDAKYADYSAAMTIVNVSTATLPVAPPSSMPLDTGIRVLIGLQSFSLPSRHSHVIAFDESGAKRMDIPLSTEEGGYLYLTAAHAGKARVLVATDDGQLSLFDSL